MFLRWKYVLLYVLVIYLTSYLVPFATAALSRLGLGWIIRYSPVIAVLIAVCCVGFWLARAPRGPSVLGVLLLVILGGGYGVLIHLLSDFPVERIHLLEYGVLAFLLVRVIEGNYGPVRTAVYTVSLVFLTGFIDEILQGVLPNRYYDSKDVAVNLVSGMFGLGLLYAARHSKALAERRAAPSHHHLPRTKSFDVACGAAVLLSLVALAVIEYQPVNESLLYGMWERPSRCGGMERFRFWPEGFFSWEDTQGNFVRGRYRLGANHLEGLKIAFSIEVEHNLSTCGLISSGRHTVSSYLTASDDRFYFNQHEDRPWFRRGAE